MENLMIMLRTLLLFLCLQTLPLQQKPQKDSSLNIIFWNMENFFDYKDGGEGESDKEFSSFGSRHWTKKRFMAKCNAVAKTMLWMQDRYGRLPDVIGLAEIENRNVLYRLLNDTALKKKDYAFIHFDGRDRRGIDVALLYRKSVMSPEAITRKQVISADGDTLATRDILYVRMQMKDPAEGPQTIALIVNHHPSKFGGASQSEQKRYAAMAALESLVDSLASSLSARIIAMGDFNDTPDSAPFEIISEALINKAADLHEKGLGTIRYEGKWDLIDMFMVSPAIAENTEMEIVKVPFLMVEDTKHQGKKPLRTYSGPKYLGGVSDHCPILLHLSLP